jgi:transposase-like protein
MSIKLPAIPIVSTLISDVVSVDNQNGVWTYWVYLWPIYTHEYSQRKQFRYIAATLVNSGLCKQIEIVRAFGVDRKMLGRAQQQLRERGAESFFQKRSGRKGGTILTEERLAQAQQLLNEGLSRTEVARQLQIKADTLRKGLKDGRLTPSTSSTDPSLCGASTQSERTREDARAGEPIGVAATNSLDRVAASMGLIDGVESRFQSSLDVPMAGVLCSLPSVLANGLLSGIDKLGKLSGYYSLTQILLVLVFMMLARIRSVEQLRGYAPGEFGKLIGLDRIPEVRCLRSKIDSLAGEDAAQKWSCTLSEQWLQELNGGLGFLYIDGPVKVYGGQVELPRRYVSRQRLCLRGISSYWVNDAIGQPFFVVEKQIDPGLIETIKTDILERLIKEAPDQPSEAQLQADPHLHRFVIVFDREASSPEFFQYLWDERRIGCLTYKKNCTQTWAEQEFKVVKTHAATGESIAMKLAERGVYLGKKRFLVKEIRKLTDSGHQTSIICTAKRLDATQIAPGMFARWSPENFFAYAKHHFNIDALSAHTTESFCGTETIVNPRWRELDRQQRSLNSKLTKLRAGYLAMDTQKRAEPSHKNYVQWELSKAHLLDEIEGTLQQLQPIKEAKKEIKRHVQLDELPEQDQFARLCSSRRTLLNAIAMIAYRAETAMCLLFEPHDYPLSKARSLMQDLFVRSGDWVPDDSKKQLNIYLHSAATQAENRRIEQLLEQLNETETVFPNTDLKMVFHSHAQRSQGTFEFPRDQEI